MENEKETTFNMFDSNSRILDLLCFITGVFKSSLHLSVLIRVFMFFV